jgi:beta-1,4-N-acetylglucosaminyltransferase
MKVLLVASSGGHIAELHALAPFWRRHDYHWVSFPTSDAEFLLADEPHDWAHYPTNRNLPNLLRNLRLAWRILGREKPDLVLSTGAGVALPFLLLGRLRGARTVYVESLARIRELSLTGRLVYPFVHAFWVQWEELAPRYRKAVYRGRVVG